MIEKIDPPDPVACIISENIIRRHLTTGQRAMIAEKISILPAGNPNFSNLTDVRIAHITQKEAAKQLVYDA